MQTPVVQLLLQGEHHMKIIYRQQLLLLGKYPSFFICLLAFLGNDGCGPASAHVRQLKGYAQV